MIATRYIKVRTLACRVSGILTLKPSMVKVEMAFLPSERYNDTMNIKVIAENKKARFDYEIIESFEAGIELTGPEVKSIRDGHISLKESFANVHDNQLWLNNAHVSPYKPAAGNNSEPTRPRRLLMKRSEINELIGKIQISGYTVVPVKIYFSHGIIKLEIALARGKKLHDKRNVIKNRETEREMSRELKDSNH